MTIGEKIRKARKDIGLTQSELSGNVITRNMLSQIENGGATPSLATIKHIAKTLELPAGYFLSTDDDEFVYRKITQIDNIRSAFREGDYEGCLLLCDKLGGEDDETNHISAACMFRIAIGYYKCGQMVKARKMAADALRSARKTIYCPEPLVVSASNLLLMIENIDPSLKAIDTSEEKLMSIVSSSEMFGIFIYGFALRQIESGQLEEAKLLINAGLLKKRGYLGHIVAKLLISDREYEVAEQKLIELISNETHLPLKFKLYSDLEYCYIELGDYENAYKCANKKLILINEMRD